MGMQLLFESTTELGGAEGIGLLAGPVEGLDAGGLKVPPDRLEPGHVDSAQRLSTRDCPTPAPSTTPTRSRRGRRDPEDVLGTAEYGSEFVSVVERPPVHGLQLHPGRSAPTGCGCCANSSALRGRGRMILLPAVDIRDGKAVRLRQGRFEEETVYADDPLEAARSFVEAGARYLHVVDLDGAREGEPANLEHLERITPELGVPVEYGGGLRSLARCGGRWAAGADRVVLGTAAYTDGEFLEAALEELGHHGSSWPSTCAAEGSPSRAGRKSDADASRGPDRPPAASGRHALRLHECRQGRDARRRRCGGGTGGSPPPSGDGSSGPAVSGYLEDLRVLRDLRLLGTRA